AHSVSDLVRRGACAGDGNACLSTRIRRICARSSVPRSTPEMGSFGTFSCLGTLLENPEHVIIRLSVVFPNPVWTDQPCPRFYRIPESFPLFHHQHHRYLY